MVEIASHKRLIANFLLALAFIVPLAIYRGTFNPVLLKISLVQLVLLIILALWFHQVLIRRKGLTLLRSPLDWPLFFFFSLSLISLFNSPYRWAGGPAIYRLVTYLLLYWVSVNVYRDRRNLSGLVFVWLLSTGLASLYGLYQYFFQGMTPPRSTFGNANFFAAYLVLLFPLTLTLFLSSIFSYRNSQVTPHLNPLPQGERRFAYIFPLPIGERAGVRGELRKKWLRIFSTAVLLLVMTLSLFLASSRGAWLGLGLGLISLSWLSCLKIKRRWLATRIIPAFLLLLLILTAFLIPRLLEKEFVREELERGTTGLRMLIWEGTARMIAAHPFLGSGPGSFQVAYPKHRLPEYFRNPHAVDATAHAHNEFLEIAAETGILGLAAFLWVLIVFFIKGISIVKREGDGSKRVLTMGLISGVVGLLATNLVGVNLRFPSSAIFFWLAMGLVMSQAAVTKAPIISQQRAVSSRQFPDPCSLTPVLRRIIFGLALLLVVGAGWQVVAKPFLAERHFQRGINYRKVGDWERAISKYRKAVELDPSFIRVYYRLGFAYAAVGDLNKAIAAYERVIDLAPDFARVQANIAFLYKEKGKLDKAIQAYRRALELNPYDTKAIPYLKELYDEIGSGL